MQTKIGMICIIRRICKITTRNCFRTAAVKLKTQFSICMLVPIFHYHTLNLYTKAKLAKLEIPHFIH